MNNIRHCFCGVLLAIVCAVAAAASPSPRDHGPPAPSRGGKADYPDRMADIRQMMNYDANGSFEMAAFKAKNIIKQQDNLISDKNMNIFEEIREWIIVVGGAAAFIIGLCQYRRAQKWQRMEWIASEVKAFLSDPHVKIGLLILDWKERVLPMLLDAPEKSRQKTFDYTEAMLDHALSSRSRPQKREYSDQELVIRDCMDRLLDGLDHFEVFIQSGLILPSEIYPFIGYWIDILGNQNSPRKSPAARKWIHHYIADYGFENVPKLLKRFQSEWK